MISYSPQSMRAFTALYRPYNDIDIYVEDQLLAGLYERIFARLLDGIAKIRSVTPLGNRDAVINEARRLKGDSTRRRFFLVDGDFFWILGPLPRVRGLYTLRCYSIENLAFERHPILSTAYSFAPDRPTSNIDAALSDDDFNLITELLFPLFKTYALCRLLKSDCTTVSYSVHRLLQDAETHLLSNRAIAQRIREIHIYLRRTFSWAEIVQAKKTVCAALKKNEVFDARFISGKSYLLGIILRWFQQEVNFRGNPRQLLSLILERSPLSIDPGLAKALRRAAKRAL